MPYKVGADIIIDDSKNINAGVTTATSFSGPGSNLTSLDASNLSTGTVATARLGSGTANSSTYLRGDQTWASIAAGGFSNMCIYTAPGTFTVPASTSKVKVTVTGSGGFTAAAGTGIALLNLSGPTSVPITTGPAVYNPWGPFAYSTNSCFGSYVISCGGGSTPYGFGNAASGAVSFPCPAPTYQACIALNGAVNRCFNVPFGPSGLQHGDSFWGRGWICGVQLPWGPTCYYAQNSCGAAGLPNSGVFTPYGGACPFTAGNGVVIVEW